MLYSEVTRRASGVGSVELLGGTGRFAGVTGSCTYESTSLAQDRVVTMSDCTWSRSAEQE